MKKLALLTLSFILITGMGFSQGKKWQLDAAHSEITFKVDHMVISSVTGQFEEFDISLTTQGEDFTKAKAAANIKVNSINTKVEKRDEHLKSDDFFDAANHPEITFVSKSFKKVSDTEYEVTGDMTIRGTTKTMTFKATYNGKVKDPWGNTRIGWTVTGSLNRFDYGLKWNAALEAGGLVVGETVDITANIEFIEPK